MVNCSWYCTDVLCIYVGIHSTAAVPAVKLQDEDTDDEHGEDDSSTALCSGYLYKMSGAPGANTANDWYVLHVTASQSGRRDGLSTPITN